MSSCWKYFVTGMLFPVILFAESRDKIAGDKAFQDGDYSTAASFYEHLLREARQIGDHARVREAMERRIDALILSRDPDGAEKLLREYKLSYPGADPIAATMWNAEIMLLKNQPETAKKEIERILPALTTENPRRVHALLLLARSCEKLEEYSAAAELYFSIAGEKRKGKRSKQQLSAWERGIFCLAFTPDAEEALVKIAESPELLVPERAEYLKLLTCFLSMKLEPEKKSAALWDSCRALEANRKNELSYPIFSAIGDNSAARNDLETAIEAYASAYEYAPDNQEAFQTLQRLLLVINAADQKETAANLALKTLDLFRGNYATVGFRERIAEILKEAKKYKEVEQIFLNIARDPAATAASKENAMGNLAKLSGKISVSQETNILLDQYFTGEKTGIRHYLYGESLLEDDKFDLAEQAFRSVAEQYPEWKQKALYQAAYCGLSRGKAAEALQYINQLFLEKLPVPLEADALFLQARILEETGKQKEAFQIFERYAAHPGKKELFEIQALFRSGRLAFLTGDSVKAIALFDRLIKQFPNIPQSADAANWKIYIYRANGDDYRAERATYELSRSWPETQVSFDALYLLAENNIPSESYHRVDQSLQALFQQSRNRENQARVLCGRAALALYHKKYQEAGQFLDQIRKDYQGCKISAEAAYLQGDLHRINGSYETALESYKKVLALNPAKHLKEATLGSIGDTCFTLGGKQQNGEFFAKALESYQQLLQEETLEMGLRSMTLYKAGRSLEHMGNDEKAAGYYKETIYLPAAFHTPVTRLWCTKAAEAIYSIAEERPTRQNIENAAAALNLLEKYQIIPAGSAARRTEILRKARFRPFGSR